MSVEQLLNDMELTKLLVNKAEGPDGVYHNQHHADLTFYSKIC